MHIPINVQLLNQCVKAIKKYPQMAIPITSSFSSSQLISKHDIIQDIEKNTDAQSICILAGWFSIGFALLFTKQYDITSVDIDPKCEHVGKYISPNINFITTDICLYKPVADIIINTSTEHIDRLHLQISFSNIQANTLCYFQNNDMDWMDGHINCFKDLISFQEFISEDFIIHDAFEIPIVKPNYTGKRFHIKCTKKPMCA